MTGGWLGGVGGGGYSDQMNKHNMYLYVGASREWCVVAKSVRRLSLITESE